MNDIGEKFDWFGADWISFVHFMQNADEEQIECKQTAFLMLMNAARGKGMFGREGKLGKVERGHLSQAPIKYPAKEHFTRFIAIFLPPHYALSG